MGQLVNGFYEQGVGTIALGACACSLLTVQKSVSRRHALFVWGSTGIGADYDEAMMRVIAQSGRGQYFLIGE